ncbi:hypothetical protein HK405_009573, partial [Cladochytrium tenue]
MEAQPPALPSPDCMSTTLSPSLSAAAAPVVVVTAMSAPSARAEPVLQVGELLQDCLPVLAVASRSCDGSVDAGQPRDGHLGAIGAKLLSASRSSSGLADSAEVCAPYGAYVELPQSEALQPTLLPFQRRTVQWLLHREGYWDWVSQQNAGSPRHPAQMGYLAARCNEEDMTDFVADVRLSGNWLSAPTSLLDEARSFKGGILADEMGLGKTVE